MIRKSIKGFDRDYTLEELKSIAQYKFPFDVFDENNIPYYKDLTPIELQGEKFYKYPKDEHVEVSNLGRVRIGSKILNQVDDKENHPNGGYLFCPEYSRDKYGYPLYVYQLVVDTWIGPNPSNKKDEGYQRHHINNNGYDNRPCNLIWLTRDEHRMIPKPSAVKV